MKVLAVVLHAAKFLGRFKEDIRQVRDPCEILDDETCTLNVDETDPLECGAPRIDAQVRIVPEETTIELLLVDDEIVDILRDLALLDRGVGSVVLQVGHQVLTRPDVEDARTFTTHVFLS